MSPRRTLRHCALALLLVVRRARARRGPDQHYGRDLAGHARVGAQEHAARGVPPHRCATSRAQKTYSASTGCSGLQPEPDVQVQILAAGPKGWQARAVHQQQAGRSCVIFVGSVDGVESPSTDGDHEMAGEEGVPLCDRMR